MVGVGVEVGGRETTLDVDVEETETLVDEEISLLELELSDDVEVGT